MSILSKLFGRKDASPAEPTGEEYQGYTVFADPMKEGSIYRLAARIEKAIGDDVKVHHLVRADTFNNLDQAKEASRLKAHQMIDEQGDRLFG